MADIATISGVGNKFISLSDFVRLDEEFLLAQARVKSDWFEAQISIEASRDRLNTFVHDIFSLLHGRSPGVVSLNSESGNLDLEMSLNLLGQLSVVASISKNMIDGELVKISMMSDTAGLENFLSEIKYILLGDPGNS